jgi:hypothetical protein
MLRTATTLIDRALASVVIVPMVRFPGVCEFVSGKRGRAAHAVDARPSPAAITSRRDQAIVCCGLLIFSLYAGFFHA